MKNLKSMLVISVLAVAVATLSARKNDSWEKSQEQDPFIGTWVGTIVESLFLPSGEGYYTQTINADKTAQTSTTAALQQPLVGFPGGLYVSLQHGSWKRVGKRCYKVATNEVVNLKDLSNPLLPGIPQFRTLLKYTVTLSKDGQSYTLEGTESLFEITDQTFTKPIIDPSTGKPIVFTFTGFARRFSQLG